MKKLTVIILSCVVFAACNNTQTSVQTTPPPATENSNANLTARRSSDATTVSSHSTSATPPPATSKPSTSGNSPMAKGVDVAEQTANIEKAEKAYKAKPTDEKLKDALAEAYFVRAFDLTEAAQYRAALGDFRKGLKLKPDAKEAKQMHDQIIDIFKSIGREPPKEGEEPPPIPVEKKP